MNTLTNKYVSTAAIIYKGGLSIHAVGFHPNVGPMLAALNTKAILHQYISSYPSLKKCFSAT